MREIPRIARRAEERGLAAAHREFLRVGLADDDGARRLKRATTVASSSGTRSSNSALPPVVRVPAVSMMSLIAIGTPCSGPRNLPALLLRIELLRLRERLRLHHGDERVELRIVDRDARKAGLRQLRRRDGARAHACCGFREREAGELVACTRRLQTRAGQAR